MSTTTMSAPPSAGSRHEWIDELCARLERVLLGRVADELLTGDLPERAALVVLPVWRWLAPRIEMGRKTIRADGDTMLMPVRMTWGPSPLLLVTGPVTAGWSMLGLGHSGVGQVDLFVQDGAAPLPAGDAFPTAGGLGVQPISQRRLRTKLKALSADGRQARWDALMSLEGYVTRAVRTAVVAVSYDIAGAPEGTLPDWVLDETASQGVADRMLLGTTAKRGRVDHLLERCLEPGAFIRVDPLKYVVKDLHRSAEAEVRKTIDDPHIGRKIRAVQRTMPSASLVEVISAYRVHHPGDHLSTVRAERALTAGPDVMAAFTDLGEAELAVPSHENAILDRLSRVSVTRSGAL